MERDQTDWLHDLFVEHSGAVRRYAARRITVASVDDVVAEVFTRAFQLGTPPEHTLAWLLTTAGYVIAHSYRTETRRLANERRAALHQVETGAAGQGDEAILTRLDVQVALSRLRHADAELLRLAYWDDLPHAVLAQVVDCSEAAVKVRLHRARQRLTDVLNPSTAPSLVAVSLEES